MPQSSFAADEFLTDAVREQIGRLSDEIIPPHSGKPSASEVGVHTQHIDAALRSRPDLIEPLTVALKALDAGIDLSEIDEGALTSVIELIVVCYFMAPAARRSIEYPGQLPVPIAEGEAEYYLEEGDILQPVIARGSRWRPVAQRA